MNSEQGAMNNEQKTILFYGALEKRKGLDILLEALKLLITNYQLPVTKLLIVGTGPEKENLKLQVTNYKLQNNIIFLDWMANEELPALLNLSDVFVFPSRPIGGWEEQFGYAMAEASACGIPVVATNIGSIDEVIVNDKSGLLVSPNNAPALAEAISKILSDNELKSKMGLCGREHIERNFSHKVVASKLLDFLKSA